MKSIPSTFISKFPARVAPKQPGTFSKTCTALLGCLLMQTGLLRAGTATENNVLHIVPAPGAVKVDGKSGDWDLSGGIFSCDDVERFRDQFSVQFFAMYDKENLYLLAKIKDPTPLNHTESGQGGHGFAGDSLQVRFIVGYKTPQEKVSHWMCWQDRDKVGILEVQYDRNFKGEHLGDAEKSGAKQVFLVDSDGKGYTQEISIPWKLLTKDGAPLSAGDSVRMAIEPNFTAGPYGRINIHDIFLSGVVPDRVFTFRAYDQWGVGTLEKEGKLQTPPVRLSDQREFPAKVENGALAVDWSGLIQKKELSGFKTIPFDVPTDGYVSLNIKNAKGEVVRQLLTENFYEKGKHEVKWDGLTNPSYKTPGQPVEAGAFTWEAISHPPFTLTLRGSANSGASESWENGPTTNWGGDHGTPHAVATDANSVYLSWTEAEAGKSLIACDFDGKVKWRIGTGLGHSSYFLAVDKGILYTVGREDIYRVRQVVRLRTSDGVFDNWKGRTGADLNVSELWADKPDKDLWPQEADGLDVKNGKLYLSFSSQQILPDAVTDWKAFVTKLMEDQPLSKRIFSSIDPRATSRLKDFLADKRTEKETRAAGAGRATFERESLRALNKLLDATDLVAGTDKMAPLDRRTANRKFLESYFNPGLAQVKTNFIAVANGDTGALLKTFEVPSPGALHALNDKQVAFLSGGTSLLVLDTETGKTNTIVSGLDHPSNFTVDAAGKFYVAVEGDSQQVQIFSVEGKPAGSIGKKGGRQLLGKWQPEGMHAPSAVAIDTLNNRLWVTESENHPKRVSVWNLADGKLVQDFFGASHYGNSGSTIDPLDPNIMIAVGCEWRLDPKTGRSVPTGIIDRNDLNGIPIHTFAVFNPAANKRLYLATITSFGVDHGVGGLRVYERVGEGDYKLRSEWRPDLASQTTAVWSDVNGDGKQDAAEITTLPFAVMLYGEGQWSGNINPADLTLYGALFSEDAAKRRAESADRLNPAEPNQKIFEKVFRINPDGFTECGAPKWDLKNMQDLSYVWSKDLQARSFGMLPSKDNKLLVAVEDKNFRCYDISKGTLLWSYPNAFASVHASHLAPPPLPGLIRGAFGLVGTFQTPETGTVWAINGNCGEWYLLNQEGYFLGHLFQGDVMNMKFPDKGLPGADMTEAPPGLGGEDFGGTLIQGADGKVYVQAGKVAAWNILASGFDQVKGIGKGKVEISDSDLALARKEQETQMQVAVGNKTLNIKRLSPEFTGNLNKDFTGVTPLMYQKSEDSAVRSYAAWDETALYLGWDVVDNTPWTNGATEPAQMYVSGDTVDFQFAQDAKANPKRGEAVAGDFRISIGNYQGKPTAVLYRTVSETKKPKAFSSGVIAHYEMQYVDVLPEARIQMTPRPDKKGYIIEVSIPWSAIGFTPVENVKYHGDLGVTHGNEAGTRTRLRTYWSNQETGLVDDVVFELKLVPRNWGDFIFQK